jgi:hypothetical protein
MLFQAPLILLQDAQEIESLIKFLVNEEGSEGVVLIGHSTGCQVGT